MENNYDALESQIGNAGGIPSSEEPKNNLGKIQHTEILTGQAQLTPEEQAQMEAFRARGRKEREARKEKDNMDYDTSTVNISDGWIMVDRNRMGKRSQFYPEDWEFFIKPATVMAIKNWSSVDEENRVQTTKLIHEILRTSVKVVDGFGNPVGWSKINTWDKFWFVLLVREITFPKGESKIEFEDRCSECDADLTYVLNADSLAYEFPDDELIEKYWVDNKWKINPKEFDIDAEEIILYPPTAGKDDALIDWARAKAEARQKVDENFLAYLIWMLPRANKDIKQLNKDIDNIYKKYRTWDYEMHDFMTQVVRNVDVTMSENLCVICPNCGQEAMSVARFPKGIKTLFKPETKAKKFGSR